jgi:DNA repair exonuclease SbcCD ATPase subunit
VKSNLTIPRPGWRHLTTVVLVAGLVLAAGCGRLNARKAPAPDPAKPVDKEWTVEEISKDPQGYMRWADGKIQTQLADRRERLKALTSRLADVRVRQKNLTDSIEEIENLHNRMKTAVQRADDEDRWPVKIGGQAFTIPQANAIIQQTRKYVDDRQSLTKAYLQAVARLEDGERMLRKDMEDLSALRDKLALDLERVRLNQGMEELQRLRNTESEIAGYSKALSQAADDSLIMATLPTSGDEQKVDVNSFLTPPNP